MSMTLLNPPAPKEFELLPTSVALNDMHGYGHPTYRRLNGYKGSDAPYTSVAGWGIAVMLEQLSDVGEQLYLTQTGAWIRNRSGNPAAWQAWKRLDNQ